MTTTRPSVLLLVGSPKGLERGSSARLGRLLVDGLTQRGWASNAIHLHAAVANDEGRRELVAAVDQADVVVLAAPLYVDYLPAPAVRALECIAANRQERRGESRPRFVSLIQCGFVEPNQNDTCQRILERFADHAGLEWVTGISLGSAGRIVKRGRRALALLAEALDLEILVPQEVQQLSQSPRAPGWLYVLAGNLMWRRLARRHGSAGQLDARPDARP